jgi:hypothetical protein
LSSCSNSVNPSVRLNVNIGTLVLISVFVVVFGMIYGYAHFKSQKVQVSFLSNVIPKGNSCGSLPCNCKMLSSYTDDKASAAYPTYVIISNESSSFLAPPSVEFTYMSYRNKYFEYVDDCYRYWDENCALH